VIERQAAELVVLRAQLAQLGAGEDGNPPRAVAPPPHVPPVLFVDQEAVDKVKDAAIASREGDKKLSLPDIIPGFKANSLDVREYTVFSHPLVGVVLSGAIGPSVSGQ
jgi:hypothetical protein